MLPFMAGRPVAIRRGKGGAFSRRDVDGPIRVDDAGEFSELVGKGATAFFISPIADSGEVWFSLSLKGVGLPFEVVRLTTLKLLLVLEDAGLDGLLVYDGNGEVLVMWTYGLIDPDDIPGDLWRFQHGVAAALQERVEARLAGTPERDRIGRWLGFDGPVTRLEGAWLPEGTHRGGGTGGKSRSGGTEGRDAVVISTGAMSPNGLMRVPYSMNEDTGLASRPVTRSDLYRFDRERHASPDRVRRLRRRHEVPLNLPRAVTEELEIH
jgi:hypothetical protein